MSSKYDFSGKTAIITGSSSGIGAATAVQFARYGADVTITGRNEERLTKVSEEIREQSGKEALLVVGNIDDDGFCRRLIDETLERFGRIDILVNNAGVFSFGDKLADESLLEEFDRMMRVNVRSVIELTQLAVPQLEQNEGNVVNISSAVGIKPYTLGYSTTKAALDMVTKTSAMELGPKKIRVNSVSPGFVYTNIFEKLGNPTFFEDNEQMLKNNHSILDRIASPDDMANLIVFLASPDAANITGSVMVNDAGFLLK